MGFEYTCNIFTIYEKYSTEKCIDLVYICTSFCQKVLIIERFCSIYLQCTKKKYNFASKITNFLKGKKNGRIS